MNTELDYQGEVVAGRHYCFEVVEPMGLCTRPSAVLCNALGKMQGDITIGNGDQEGNGRSIMDIMAMEFYHGRAGILRFTETQPAAPLEATRDIIRIMGTTT